MHHSSPRAVVTYSGHRNRCGTLKSAGQQGRLPALAPDAAPGPFDELRPRLGRELRVRQHSIERRADRLGGDVRWWGRSWPECRRARLHPGRVAQPAGRRERPGGRRTGAPSDSARCIPCNRRRSSVLALPAGTCAPPLRPALTVDQGLRGGCERPLLGLHAPDASGSPAPCGSPRHPTAGLPPIPRDFETRAREHLIGEHRRAISTPRSFAIHRTRLGRSLGLVVHHRADGVRLCDRGGAHHVIDFRELRRQVVRRGLPRAENRFVETP